MESSGDVSKCPNCNSDIDYGFSHQWYSDIYSKLFNSMWTSKNIDKELDTVIQKLTNMKAELKRVLDLKKQHLRDARKE